MPTCIQDAARGVRNQSLSPNTWAAIERALATWADLAPVCLASNPPPLDEDNW